MDLGVEVVVHDCVGDELATAHIEGVPVEGVRVEDFVLACWDASVDVDDENLALERFGPCCLLAALEVLPGRVAIARICRIDPNRVKESDDSVAKGRFRGCANV